ncbi:MAG: DNA translocase FtsK, partial [Acholeplasmataceae bacterium]|nr:DNA translocase FtsK [Acholeplasmataceae bacterium]
YAVTDFIRKQGEPTYLIQHESLKQSIEISDVIDESIFKEVATFVVTEDSASINRIQKEFNLGFNKAQRIMGMLESFGIVSENQGTKAREVIATLQDLEEILKKNS